MIGKVASLSRNATENQRENPVGPLPQLNRSGSRRRSHLDTFQRYCSAFVKKDFAKVTAENLPISQNCRTPRSSEASDGTTSGSAG